MVTVIACDKQVFVIQNKAAEDCHSLYGKNSKNAKRCIQGTYYAEKNLVKLLCRDDIKSCIEMAYFQCGEHNFHNIDHNNPCVKGVDFFLNHGNASLSYKVLDHINRSSRSAIGEKALTDNIRSSQQRNYSQKINIDNKTEQDSVNNSISV